MKAFQNDNISPKRIHFSKIPNFPFVGAKKQKLHLVYKFLSITL